MCAPCYSEKQNKLIIECSSLKINGLIKSHNNLNMLLHLIPRATTLKFSHISTLNSQVFAGHRPLSEPLILFKVSNNIYPISETFNFAYVSHPFPHQFPLKFQFGVHKSQLSMFCSLAIHHYDITHLVAPFSKY